MEPETSAPPSPAIPPADPKEVLQKLLDGLGLETKVSQHTMDESMLLHIETPEPGRLIGKHGQTLNELQFLLNRILQRISPGVERVTVDCERYRERQRDEILQKAVQASERVRRWGEPVEVGPFSAFDRRIIHHHFASDPELEAVSEEADDGGRKKMVIRVRPPPPSAPPSP